MPSFCVRILKNGRPCGAGILVDPQHVVTCAHVVNSAVGACQLGQEMPSGIVSLDFPWATRPRPISAMVAGWHPPAPYGTAPAGLADMAVLRLEAKIHDSPAALDLSISEWGDQKCFTMGFTESAPQGVTLKGTTRGMLSGARIEMAVKPSEGTVESGFSGAPVSFGSALEHGRVAGMVFAYGLS